MISGQGSARAFTLNLSAVTAASTEIRPPEHVFTGSTLSSPIGERMTSSGGGARANVTVTRSGATSASISPAFWLLSLPSADGSSSADSLYVTLMSLSSVLKLRCGAGAPLHFGVTEHHDTASLNLLFSCGSSAFRTTALSSDFFAIGLPWHASQSLRQWHGGRSSSTLPPHWTVSAFIGSSGAHCSLLSRVADSVRPETRSDHRDSVGLISSAASRRLAERCSCGVVDCAPFSSLTM